MNMLISIIIPCFNASGFIKNCFSSLLSQTYVDWEAIFIDDGSADNTWQLLQNLSVEDMRVKVFTKQNEGAGKTREFGILKANGEYITFLDVDDTLTPDALHGWINAFDAQTDIVVSGFNMVENGKVVKRKILKGKYWEGTDYLKQVIQGRCGWELCGKVYRKKLFVGGLQFPSIRIGEDAVVFIQLLCRASRIAICSGNYYNYTLHSASASHVQSIFYAEETLRAASLIDEILKEKPFYSYLSRELDVMYLLFYSNSTRKAFLGKKHPLVANIFQKHFNWRALGDLPLLKGIYIVFSFLAGEFIYKYVGSR